MLKITVFAFALPFISTPALSQDFIKLNSNDLAAQTNKWKGKQIETIMTCYYADIGDVRCSGSGNSRIDITTVSNKDGKDRVESKCDTITKSATSACRFRIRFTYEDWNPHEVGSMNKTITLISIKDETAELLPAR